MTLASADISNNDRPSKLGAGGNGGGSGGRSITMNVTLNNNFSVAQKGMDIQKIVEQVCTQISLRLGDAMVAMQ